MKSDLKKKMRIHMVNTYSVVGGIEIDAGLVELTRNLDITGSSHELDPDKSARRHDTSTMSGLGAVAIFDVFDKLR